MEIPPLYLLWTVEPIGQLEGNQMWAGKGTFLEKGIGIIYQREGVAGEGREEQRGQVQTLQREVNN